MLGRRGGAVAVQARRGREMAEMSVKIQRREEKI